MNIAAAMCYAVSFVTEMYGLLGIVHAARGAKQMQGKPSHGYAVDVGSVSWVSTHSDQSEFLLRQSALPWTAIGALGVGIATGFAGNLLSL